MECLEDYGNRMFSVPLIENLFVEMIYFRYPIIKKCMHFSINILKLIRNYFCPETSVHDGWSFHFFSFKKESENFPFIRNVRKNCSISKIKKVYIFKKIPN